MAKRRMAGEKVAEEMSRADSNRAARERRGNNPEQLAERLESVDRDKYDFSGYDDKAINMAFRGGTFGDEDYARLTGEEDQEVSIPKTPKTDAEIGPGTETEGPQEKAEDLKDGYVNEIINQGTGGNNTAMNTGDVSVTGSNYGTANAGVIDYSVNIQGGDKDGRGLSNMKSAQAYQALNENQYERSRSKLTGTGQAAKYSAMAEDLVGSEDRVKGLDRQTDTVSNYYRDLGKKQNVMAFGDYLSPYFRAPRFVGPEAPSKIEVNYKPSDD